MNDNPLPDPIEESTVYCLNISAHYENLNAVREFVGWIASAAGMSERSVFAVQMAADEACTNIIEHAYGGESNQKIDCFCQVTPQELVITLHDHGQPFNPLKVPEPDFTASLEERDNGGLGLYLMRKLMDDVQFTFQPSDQPRDNILTMIKRRTT